LFSFILAGQPNHQAVLITGDTPEGAHKKMVEAYLMNDSFPELWDYEGAKELFLKGEGNIYEAFWNDTYLMWEILYTRGWPDENIHVLDGDGRDYYQPARRYQARYHDLRQITDRPAYYADVEDIFSDLANGDPSAGIEPMGPDDNLFVWTFDHGFVAGEFISINIENPDSPMVVDRAHGPTAWKDIHAKENYVYASGRVGIYVMEVDSQGELSIISALTDRRRLGDMDIDGNIGTVIRRYITEGFMETCKLLFIDFTEPANPMIFDSIEVYNGVHTSFRYITACKDSTGYAGLGNKIVKTKFGEGIIGEFTCENCDIQDICMFRDTLLACADMKKGLRLINTREMKEVCKYDLPGLKRLYVTDTSYIFAVTDTVFYSFKFEMGNISLLGEWHSTRRISDLAVDKDVHYGYILRKRIGLGHGYLIILDLSDISSPVEISNVQISNRGGEAIALKDNFVYVLSPNNNRYVADSMVTLWLMDRPIIDYEFSSLLDSISCNRRIFWMQQCHSGGFINELEGDNSIIITACKYNQGAFGADDYDFAMQPLLSEEPIDFDNWVPAIENECDTVTNKTYYHGEFNFHIMNGVRQKKIYPYDDPPVDTLLNPDRDGNRGVSMKEDYNYVGLRDSRIHGTPNHPEWAESPQFSDIGNIAKTTYLEWDDFSPPSTPSGFTFSYKRDDDTTWGIHLLWDDNNEVDMSGYRLFREESLLKRFYKRTSWVDYAMDMQGEIYRYSLTAFDLWGYESDTTYLYVQYPIGISDSLKATGFNNARRIVAFKGNVYVFYSSSGSVYFVVSHYNGDKWSKPVYVGKGGLPSAGLISGDRVFVAYRSGKKLYYCIVQGENISKLHEIPVSWNNIITLSLSGPSVRTISDSIHIFVMQNYTTEMQPYITSVWMYCGFDIDNPEFNWEIVDDIGVELEQPTLSPSITLKNNTPLLAYDKLGDVYYAQKIENNWRRWRLSQQRAFSPCIDYSKGSVNLVWCEYVDTEYVSMRCADITPATDTVLNYRMLKFKFPVKNPSSPFVIANSFLFWSEQDGGYRIKMARFNERSFVWDSLTDLSNEIPWFGSSQHPQATLFSPIKTDKNVKELITVWSQGIEPDVGIQKWSTGIEEKTVAIADLGRKYPSPYTVQREGYIDYSGEGIAEKTVDCHPEELIYHISGLDPDTRYSLGLLFYQSSGSRWKERVEVDGTPRGEIWVDSEEMEWFEKKIPPSQTEDGEITIRIKRKRGEYAVCSALYLLRQKEGAGSCSEKQMFVLGKEEPEIFPVVNGVHIKMKEKGTVKIDVYDVMGRFITKIVRKYEKGEWNVNISHLPSGMYVCRVNINGMTLTRKVIVLK